MPPDLRPADSPTSSRTQRDVDAKGDWPRAWVGHWITAPRALDRSAAPASPFSAGDSAPFGRLLYRKELDILESPRRARMRLTADSRYLLLVNGREIGRGPVRSQPRRLRFDEYDITQHLVLGHNRIVVLVTYYGAPNSFWQPAPSNGALGGRAVLVADLDLDGTATGTDSSWEVREVQAWTQPPMAGLDGVPVEQFDARRLEAGWQTGITGEWTGAAVTAATNMGALGRSQPPTDPYGALLGRPIGPLGGATVRPGLAQAGRVHPAGAIDSRTADGSPVDEVLSIWPSVVLDRTVDHSLVHLDLEPGVTQAIAFDFGRVVAGLVRFTLEAPAGTAMNVLYRETPASAADANVLSLPRTGLRYIARGDGDDFTAQQSNGFRYAHVLVVASEPGAFSLSDFQVEEHLGSWSESGSFQSSDAELNALHAAGLRTVALNTQDAFIDCPTREQRAWVGDGVVHQLVHLTNNDDRRAAAWYIDLGTSPRPDGILPMSVVGDIESGQGATIPDWSLYWIHGVHNLLMHCGPTPEVLAATPVARRVLAWFLPYLTDDGVLADVPEWGLVDWSSIFLSGESAILTAMWVWALRDYRAISAALGNNGDVQWAESLIARVETGFGRFWDEGRGTVVDHRIDGQQQPAASQLAGATAIIAGLLTPTQTAQTVAWISDPERQVVRSWIGSNGSYDADKMADQVRGVQQIDWNVERETVIAEPFAAFLVHDAFAAAGRVDLLLQNMRRWSQFLHDGLDTFGECWGWGTPAHGWSSTPARDVMQYVLGIVPTKPGFTNARITPAIGRLERFEGVHPTINGPVRVAVVGEHVSIRSPVPFTLVLPGGRESTHNAGRYDGQ